MTWIRGMISFIFTCESGQARLVLIDHQRQVVQTLWPKDFKMSDKGTFLKDFKFRNSRGNFN